MRILGLDLSLRATGWSIADEGVLHSSGTFCSRRSGMPRLAELLKLTADKAAGVDLVVIEGFAFGAKGAAVFEVAGLGYLVRYWLWKNNRRFVLVTPAQLKKFVTGTGSAKKEIIIREVFDRWKLKAADNNEADAIVLGYIGMAMTGDWTPTTTFQTKIADDLRRLPQ